MGTDEDLSFRNARGDGAARRRSWRTFRRIVGTASWCFPDAPAPHVCPCFRSSSRRHDSLFPNSSVHATVPANCCGSDSFADAVLSQPERCRLTPPRRSRRPTRISSRWLGGCVEIAQWGTARGNLRLVEGTAWHLGVHVGAHAPDKVDWTSSFRSAADSVWKPCESITFDRQSEWTHNSPLANFRRRYLAEVSEKA